VLLGLNPILLTSILLDVTGNLGGLTFAAETDPELFAHRSLQQSDECVDLGITNRR